MPTEITEGAVLKILIIFLLGLLLTAFTYLNSTKLDKEVFEIYQTNNTIDHSEIKESLLHLHDKFDEVLKVSNGYSIDDTRKKDKGDI